MFLKNSISIFRHNPPPGVIDYCLSFAGDGNISINSLASFLDYKINFYFEMQFKIERFPDSGFAYLMNSCLNIDSNKIGVAIDGSDLYVQLIHGEGNATDLFIPFTDTQSWHTLAISYDRGALSATLDAASLTLIDGPILTQPGSVGFKIASDTAQANGLRGSVDNILITDLNDPIAQYPLSTGSGNIAFDSVGSYDGSISHGEWQSHI